MNTLRTKLLKARKTYSACAQKIEVQIAALPQLTPVLSERIVGIGIAADWIRRAAEMETIIFLGDQLDDSSRKPTFVELMRFNFAWSAANALFARDELVCLLGNPASDSELDRFRVLFDAATLAPSVVKERENKIHAFLRDPTSPRLPNIYSGTPVTVVQAINAKYIPPRAQARGNGKKIKDAASTGDFSALNLPLLIYVLRNWSVHGNALDGAFGGRPRFNLYLETLLETLAEVHEGVAKVLLQQV